MGNLNSTVDGCSSEEYYRLYEKLDKMHSKLEIQDVENKAYQKINKRFREKNNI